MVFVEAVTGKALPQAFSWVCLTWAPEDLESEALEKEGMVDREQLLL